MAEYLIAKFLHLEILLSFSYILNVFYQFSEFLCLQKSRRNPILLDFSELIRHVFYVWDGERCKRGRIDAVAVVVGTLWLPML